MAHHKNSIVEVLAKKTSLIIGTITDVEFSPELITAIQDDNLGQLRWDSKTLNHLAYLILVNIVENWSDRDLKVCPPHSKPL